MSNHVPKNYMTDNGSKLVIGGELVFEGEGKLADFPGAENQADSTATSVSDLKDDFNALLAKLKAAGLMEADSEE